MSDVNARNFYLQEDAEHKMGDLKEGSLKEIWSGSAYRAFRKQLLKGRDQIDICTNCTEGCKVWAEE